MAGPTPKPNTEHNHKSGLNSIRPSIIANHNNKSTSKPSAIKTLRMAQIPSITRRKRKYKIT